MKRPAAATTNEATRRIVSRFTFCYCSSSYRSCRADPWMDIILCGASCVLKLSVGQVCWMRPCWSRVPRGTRGRLRAAARSLLPRRARRPPELRRRAAWLSQTSGAPEQRGAATLAPPPR